MNNPDHISSRETLRSIYFSVLLLVINVWLAAAQNEPSLDVFGQITSEQGNLKGVEIGIKQDDMAWLKVKYNSRNGEFNLALPLNHRFIFSFKQPGTIKKEITFSTFCPEEYQHVEFDPFFFMVRLENYSDSPEVDTLFYSEPVGKIFFSEEFIKFDYDRDYNLYVRNKIAEVKEMLLARVEEKQDLIVVATVPVLDSVESVVVPDEIALNTAVSLEEPIIKEVTVAEESAIAVSVKKDTTLAVVTKPAIMEAEIQKQEAKPIEILAEVSKPEIVAPASEKPTATRIATTNASKMVEKPLSQQSAAVADPKPVSMGKPNGKEYTFNEFANKQVTKVFVTQSRKTIIYSMYQFNDGKTRYFKQQPLSNDSIPITREIFIKSIR